MSYALGTRGYIPNLKDWDKDLYKDRGPGGEIRYKVNEKDQQYLSERQISEMKSDFLNKGQAEHTDKQYWSDIRFNESVRGTLGNIRDIPKNLVAPFKQPGITGNDRTARPNMDVPAWMKGEGDAPIFSPNYTINPENYSKYFNKKSGHFHSLLHQKQALNQYDEDRNAAVAQSRIDQGETERDQLMEANKIENKVSLYRAQQMAAGIDLQNNQTSDTVSTTDESSSVDEKDKKKDFKIQIQGDLPAEIAAEQDEQLARGEIEREWSSDDDITTITPGPGEGADAPDWGFEAQDTVNRDAANAIDWGQKFEAMNTIVSNLANIASILDSGKQIPGGAQIYKKPKDIKGETEARDKNLSKQQLSTTEVTKSNTGIDTKPQGTTSTTLGDVSQNIYTRNDDDTSDDLWRYYS